MTRLLKIGDEQVEEAHRGGDGRIEEGDLGLDGRGDFDIQRFRCR
jgi:hypothetical protein